MPSDAYIDSLVLDNSIYNASAMEILQSCTKPSICAIELGHHWLS